jgi:hypothetical protein
VSRWYGVARCRRNSGKRLLAIGFSHFSPKAAVRAAVAGSGFPKFNFRDVALASPPTRFNTIF